MKKYFCDICGKEAERAETIEYTNHKGLECDSKAKVHICIHVSFKEHSTGFGGPPDLCWYCFIKQVKDALAITSEMRKVYPDIEKTITISSEDDYPKPQ